MKMNKIFPHNQQYKDQIIEWKNPDGKITKLNFDDDGNLIGTKSKEVIDTTKPINKRYRYYEDLYGNEYRWNTHRQEDGKFKAWIVKAVAKKTWGNPQYKTIKQRSFTKRKSAIAWCLKAYLKTKTRQRKVLDEREKRKQTRLDLKPKGIEKSRIEAKEKLDHFRKLSWNIVKQRKDLQKKHEKQLRSLGTRMINYNKKVKYYRKRVEVDLK